MEDTKLVNGLDFIEEAIKSGLSRSEAEDAVSAALTLSEEIKNGQVALADLAKRYPKAFAKIFA